MHRGAQIATVLPNERLPEKGMTPLDTASGMHVAARRPTTGPMMTSENYGFYKTKSNFLRGVESLWHGKGGKAPESDKDASWENLSQSGTCSPLGR
ncbi:hypothetical protein Tdes44962_MAKER08311 [Teratosphaeria destructans]|uniref:Uncharacterized protein n=1 Tax=Teratosphaeria destructans TaxID=418781 RepID=A0A9W7SWN3_9PEZI|nr:hypothetical protein Tdes44962_MAKER08311 [Teratosphaeria destructans]